MTAEAGSMTAGTPTRGPGADEGTESDADSGNAAETLETITAVESGPMIFDFRLSGIKGVQARSIAPVSKEYGKFQALRALCSPLSRYRLNRLSFYVTPPGHIRTSHAPVM